jgi:polyisoprenoid-binding protein YceI
MTKTTRTRLLLGGGLVVLLLVGGGLWWFLSDDAPPAVDLDTAAESVTTTTAADDGTGSTVAPSDGDIAGTWTVDAASGEVEFESATGSFVGFRIGENLASIGVTEAVGRTRQVSGTLTIEGTTVTAATFEADMTAITTNESRRDDKVQSALETDQFPTATFELTEPIELAADAADGAEQTVDAVGDLTIHGVTKQVTFPLQAKLVSGTVVVVGSLPVTFADFDVEVPKSPVVVSVDDHGTLELQLLFTKG